MCNAHFQHLFDDVSYSPAGIAQQQQSQQQNTRSQLGLHPHNSSAAGQENSAPTLSPVSTNGWSYPMEAQSADVQMYSPASTTSYSSFHSPVGTSTRVYALAGALQQHHHQQQQQQQSNAGYPESSQRSTELARGGAPSHEHGGAGQGRGSAQFFPEAGQAVTQPPTSHQHQQQQQQQHQQRWGYAGHGGHAHAHDFSQEALSMSRAPIMDAPVQPTSASDDSVPQDRIPPAFAAGNVPGGARIPVAPASGAAGDRASQGGARQIHQGVPLNERAFPHLQPDQHHRAMSSQSQHPHHHQQWLPQAQSQQMGGPPFLQAPTPRAVNATQSGAMRNFFPYASAGGNAELDYDFESDDFGDHEEFDDGLDDEDGGQSHLGIPTNGSPTPELQFPQNVSGTPSDLMRANFMLYGPNPANWPMESLGGLTGSGAFIDTNAGQGPGPATPSSSRASSGGKVKMGTSMTPPEFLRPSEKRDKGKRAQGGEENEGQTVKVLVESTTPGEPPKKVKMHQCRICQKLFPRPSGLATHMNSHSGARPFKCPLDLCPKTFAVRSNARRHLRTHGITVPPNALNKNGQGRNQEEPFQVGFETPVVVDVQDPTAGGVIGDGASAGTGGRPPKLRWVPPSLATRTNAPRLRSLSPTSDMADIDAHDIPMSAGGGASGGGHAELDPGSLIFSRRVPGLRIAPSPLSPAIPSTDEGAADLNSRFEERNSYAEAGTYPYHPEQWRSLPGPGLVLALRS